MKRYFVSKHDSRDYIEKVQTTCGLDLGVARSAQVELIQPDEAAKFLVVDGNYTFVEVGTELFPFVGSKSLTSKLPSVYIDEGAIKFILKGADVMRPGILRYDEWGDKGRLLVVRDVGKERALAIGRALVASAEMASMTKGVSVKNLHYAGDRVWDSYKRI